MTAGLRPSVVLALYATHRTSGCIALDAAGRSRAAGNDARGQARSRWLVERPEALAHV